MARAGRLSSREVPCPVCGAATGERCRGVRGQAVDYHYGRREAARMASPGVQLDIFRGESDG